MEVMDMSQGVMPSWPGHQGWAGGPERHQATSRSIRLARRVVDQIQTEYSGTGPTTPPHDAMDASRNFFGRGLPLLARRGFLPTRCHYRSKESALASLDSCELLQLLH